MLFRSVERRMFAKTIIDSDVFLDLPISTQALYFHLVINANDKGIVNNIKSVCRKIDFHHTNVQALEADGFISKTDDGLYVISDWDTHNGRAETSKKRLTYRYRKWREQVLERDKYTCQNCGISKPKGLHVHHIKHFATHEDLRYDISNAITLCDKCHKNLHKEEKNNG